MTHNLSKLERSKLYARCKEAALKSMKDELRQQYVDHHLDLPSRAEIYTLRPQARLFNRFDPDRVIIDYGGLGLTGSAEQGFLDYIIQNSDKITVEEMRGVYMMENQCFRLESKYDDVHLPEFYKVELVELLDPDKVEDKYKLLDMWAERIQHSANRTYQELYRWFWRYRDGLRDNQQEVVLLECLKKYSFTLSDYEEFESYTFPGLGCTSLDLLLNGPKVSSLETHSIIYYDKDTFEHLTGVNGCCMIAATVCAFPRFLRPLALHHNITP